MQQNWIVTMKINELYLENSFSTGMKWINSLVDISRLGKATGRYKCSLEIIIHTGASQYIVHIYCIQYKCGTNLTNLHGIRKWQLSGS